MHRLRLGRDDSEVAATSVKSFASLHSIECLFDMDHVDMTSSPRSLRALQNQLIRTTQHVCTTSSASLTAPFPHPISDTNDNGSSDIHNELNKMVVCYFNRLSSFMRYDPLQARFYKDVVSTLTQRLLQCRHAVSASSLAACLHGISFLNYNIEEHK